jgi:hypothetical protein
MNNIIYLFKALFEVITGIFEKLIAYFLELNIFEKIIVINIIPAFISIIFPMVKYKFINEWRYITNPIGVYMIGIVGVMFLTLHFKFKFNIFITAGINLYYISWLIYLQLSHNITQAPYILTSGYYIAFVAPLVYLTFSLTNHFYGNSA